MELYATSGSVLSDILRSLTHPATPRLRRILFASIFVASYEIFGEEE